MANITSNPTQVLASFMDFLVVFTAYDFYVFRSKRRREKVQNLDNNNNSCCGGADLPWDLCIAGMEV